MSDLRITRRKLLAGSAWAAGGFALSRTVRAADDVASPTTPLAELGLAWRRDNASPVLRGFLDLLNQD